MLPGGKFLVKLRSDQECKVRNVVKEFPNMGEF